MPSACPALSLGPPAQRFGPSSPSPASPPPEFGCLSSRPWTQGKATDERRRHEVWTQVIYISNYWSVFSLNQPFWRVNSQLKIDLAAESIFFFYFIYLFLSLR